MMKKVSQILKAAECFEKLAKESRINFIFPANHPKVNDNKGHYPLGNVAQARNALARASQHKEVPEWWKGSLKELVSSVARKVKKEYPSIEVSEAAKKPGKN